MKPEDKLRNQTKPSPSEPDDDHSDEEEQDDCSDEEELIDPPDAAGDSYVDP